MGQAARFRRRLEGAGPRDGRLGPGADGLRRGAATMRLARRIVTAVVIIAALVLVIVWHATMVGVWFASRPDPPPSRYDSMAELLSAAYGLPIEQARIDACWLRSDTVPGPCQEPLGRSGFAALREP